MYAEFAPGVPVPTQGIPCELWLPGPLRDATTAETMNQYE